MHRGRQGTGQGRGDDGFAMSSPLALMSGAAVILAGIAFFTTGDSDAPGRATPVTAVTAVTEPAPIERTPTLHAVQRHRPAAKASKPAKPVIHRNQTYVSVFNNSNITGLAGATAARIGAAGWQVVGSDNWYGTIPATTIYYPARLKAAALLLSKDLGVQRVMPAADPMSMDRLTVILTADFT